MANGLKTTNIGLALATGADGATPPGFAQQATNQYAGMRNLAQQNRLNKMKLQTSQVNLRKAMFDQMNAELEFNQHQQDRFRKDQIRSANTALYSDLSEQYVQFTQNPDAFTDSQVVNMMSNWQRLLNSDAYSAEAQSKLADLGQTGQVRQNKVIADNIIEFNAKASNGKAFTEDTWDKLPNEVKTGVEWGRKQIGVTVDPETGMQKPEYARFAIGPSKQIQLNARKTLDKFSFGKVSIDQLLGDDEVQLMRMESKEFAELYDEVLETVSGEERGEVTTIAKEKRAEEEEIAKEKRQAARGSKVTEKVGMENPDTGEIDTITLTGTPEQNRIAKIALGLESEEGEEEKEPQGFGPAVPEKYKR